MLDTLRRPGRGSRRGRRSATPTSIIVARRRVAADLPAVHPAGRSATDGCAAPSARTAARRYPFMKRSVTTLSPSTRVAMASRRSPALADAGLRGRTSRASGPSGCRSSAGSRSRCGTDRRRRPGRAVATENRSRISAGSARSRSGHSQTSRGARRPEGADRRKAAHALVGHRHRAPVAAHREAVVATRQIAFDDPAERQRRCRGAEHQSPTPPLGRQRRGKTAGRTDLVRPSGLSSISGRRAGPPYQCWRGTSSASPVLVRNCPGCCDRGLIGSILTFLSI